jgi:hypothetical protein
MTQTRSQTKTPRGGACKHKLDPGFPQERVGAYLVGRCQRCSAVVALKK